MPSQINLFICGIFLGYNVKLFYSQKTIAVMWSLRVSAWCHSAVFMECTTNGIRNKLLKTASAVLNILHSISAQSECNVPVAGWTSISNSCSIGRTNALWRICLFVRGASDISRMLLPTKPRTEPPSWCRLQQNNREWCSVKSSLVPS